MLMILMPFLNMLKEFYVILNGLYRRFIRKLLISNCDSVGGRSGIDPQGPWGSRGPLEGRLNQMLTGYKAQFVNGVTPLRPLGSPGDPGGR